jgi:ABC-2 type transport system ATP-binding protein
MIKIKEITKKYRDATAVDHINLEIKEKEVFAFLGPNGAGKTTIILILSTLLEPTSGTASINGHDILKESEQAKREIGILYQDTSLDDRLTGKENLEIQAVLYDVPKNERAERVGEMLNFIGLTDWASVPVGRYSGGMKRRLEIARCLMHKPQVLLLDEPTLGLDPNARRVIWKYIKKLENITIVITTNYIEEAEMLSDRIAIIYAGREVALGTPEELKSSLKIDIGHITTKIPEKLESALVGLSYVDNIKIDGSKIIFTIKEGKRKDLLDTMSSYDLESIEVRRPTLSDVFLQHTGKSIDVPMERPKRKRGLRRRR